MDDQELLRYSKQIMLPQIDVEGQQKIIDSKMLIVGMGGLGSPPALSGVDNRSNVKMKRVLSFKRFRPR